VTAYKFLRAGAIAPFTGFQWVAGEWVAGGDRPLLCGGGVHACSAAQLPYWINSELWEIELAGEIVEGGHKVAASEARLLRRLEAWDERAAAALARDCLAHAPDPGKLAPSLENAAAAGNAVVACYVAAVVAERTGGIEARRAERARQAAWFAANVL
jgi:hypothetical protein